MFGLGGGNECTVWECFLFNKVILWKELRKLPIVVIIIRAKYTYQIENWIEEHFSNTLVVSRYKNKRIFFKGLETPDGIFEDIL